MNISYYGKSLTDGLSSCTLTALHAHAEITFSKGSSQPVTQPGGATKASSLLWDAGFLQW